MLKLEEKISKKVLIDNEEVTIVFDVRKLDKGLVHIQKEMIRSGVTGPESKMPPEMIENMIAAFDVAVLKDGGSNYEGDPDLFPPMVKVQIISSLIKNRIGGQEKNSPKASGE